MDYYDREMEVKFVDILDEDNKYLYFLFYEYPKHTFHRPLEKNELGEYKGLELIDIGELTTYGEDINELLSLQFCDKVYNLITKKY